MLIPDGVPDADFIRNVENRPPVKIGLYLQTYNVCDKASFQKAMAKVKKSDIDILVFPEFAYLPFEEKMKKAKTISLRLTEDENGWLKALARQSHRTQNISNIR